MARRSQPQYWEVRTGGRTHIAGLGGDESLSMQSVAADMARRWVVLYAARSHSFSRSTKLLVRLAVMTSRSVARVIAT